MLKALFVLALGLVVVPVSGCAASCNSTAKNWASETQGGIPRLVEVYSHDGKLLRSYDAKIDIETTDSSHVQIMVDGKNRKSFSNAIVIIEDK